MSDELKNCPFCGVEAILSEFRAGYVHWQVECGREECSAAGPPRATGAEAITAWNLRPSSNEALLREARPWIEYDAEHAPFGTQSQADAKALLAKIDAVLNTVDEPPGTREPE